MRAWQLAGLVIAGVIWSCAEGSSTDGECLDIFWHRDADGDGFGTPLDTQTGCKRPLGYVRDDTDCDDASVQTHPGAEEDCAVEKDYNCDGSTGYTDADMDGVAACMDCDDQDPNRYVGAMELCDGIDNDCDQLIDEEDQPANVMCDPVVNAVPTCGGEMGCQYTCEGTYVDTNLDLSDGCECYPQPDPGVGDNCATAFDLGDLNDGAADSVIIDGNIPWASTERWYRFNAVDDVDTNGDEFHVDIRFMNNPGTQYALMVYRGACPDDNGEMLATGELDTVDWFTDFNVTTVGCSGPPPCGEGDCSDIPSDSVNACEDDTAPFYVRVTRLDNVASCELFSVQFSNGVY